VGNADEETMKCTCSVSYLLNRDAKFSGWLKKVEKGAFSGKSDKKRYAVIHESTLYLFQDHNSTSSSKTIPLDEYKVQQNTETKDGIAKWGFSLCEESDGKDRKVLEFTVGSEREMNDWLTNLDICKVKSSDITTGHEIRNSYIDTPSRPKLNKEQQIHVSELQDVLSNPKRSSQQPVVDSLSQMDPRHSSSLGQQRNVSGPGVSPTHPQREQQQNRRVSDIGSRPPMPLPSQLAQPQQQHRQQPQPKPHPRQRSASDETNETTCKMSAPYPGSYEVSNHNQSDGKTAIEEEQPIPPPRSENFPKRLLLPTDPEYYEDPDNPNADAEHTAKYMPPTMFKWGLDREAATRLLTQCGTPGVYIIRKGRDRGDVISALLLGEVKNYKIFVENDKMFLHRDHPHFQRHLHMIMYYYKNNLPTCHARLETPYMT